MKIRTALALAAAFLFSACGPNRAEWMARAAKEQAAAQTRDLGSPDQVRLQAKAEFSLLNGMATGIYANADKYSGQERSVYLPLAQYLTEVASGLQAIAYSRTDADFSNAVFAMCDPEREQAEPRVGRVELAMASALQKGNIQASATPQNRADGVALLTGFGNTMISIPARCDQAKTQMVEASQEEQQAEAHHQMNVDRTLLVAETILVGTAVVVGEVGAAAATRPPVQNNYIYVNQANGY